MANFLGVRSGMYRRDDAWAAPCGGARTSATAQLRCLAGGNVAKLPEIDLEALQKIAPGDLRLLWVNDWYDGPIEAVVEHEGHRCLMVLHHEEKGADRPYSWLVIRLSAEQRADEEAWHALYVEHVGDHWCFHGSAASCAEPSTDPDAERFFRALRARPPLDLSGSTVVGWADEMPAG